MKRTVRMFLTLAFAFVTGLTFTANAQAQCKGLSGSACKANSGCVWVGGYETKKGKKVKSYCRSKGKMGSKKAVKDRLKDRRDKRPKRAEARENIKDKKKKVRNRVERKDPKKRKDRKDRKDKKKKRKKYDRKKK